MNLWCWSLLCCVILSLAMQIEWLTRYLKLFRAGNTPSLPDDQLPKVCVILSLRGADPFLAGCVRGLLQQNYPHYDVRIVVDHRHDPAWEIVQQAIDECGAAHAQVRVLESRLETCSLKLSALVQEISRLDDSYDVIALLDADVIPSPGWLRELVAPFANPLVGATTCFRWYIPPARAGAGTHVRYLWNLAASVQMYIFRIAWGGSLAIRMDAFRSADLLHRWSHTLYEDVQIYNSLHAVGQSLEFVPMLMVNRETINLRNCVRFIYRQMLNVRLYHLSWPALTAVHLVTGTALALSGVLFGWGAIAGDTGVMNIAGMGIGLYGAGMAAFWLALEFGMRRVLRKQCEPMQPLPLTALIAGPLTQAVFLACLVSTIVSRRYVEWRGVRYELSGPTRVRMLEYQPYHAPTESIDANISI